jgi:hypothetical protein
MVLVSLAATAIEFTGSMGLSLNPENAGDDADPSVVRPESTEETRCCRQTSKSNVG